MKKFLKVLLSLTLVFTFTVVLAACNFETPTDQPSVGGSSEVDLIKENAFAADEQGVYTLTNGSALEVAFNKEVAEGTEWAWMGANLESYDLSAMNSLRLNVSGTCKVLVKIEGVVGEANKGVEVTLQLSSTAVAYEWDLSGAAEKEILANATKLIFFALPGSAKGTGSFTIADAVLSPEEALYNPIQSGYVPPVKGNVYDGFSAEFHVNQLWESNDGNVYTITENGDGTVKFDFDITGWQFCATFVKGHDKFEYLNFKLAGEAGTRVTLKVEGGGKQAELHAWLTDAEEDVFTLDLSALTEGERGGLERVLFFATSGDGGKGSFVMNDVYFSHTQDGSLTSQAPAGGEATPDANPNLVQYDGKADHLDINRNYQILDADAFQLTTEVSPWVFSYSKGSDRNYSAIVVEVAGKLGNFSKIEFGAKAGAGVKFMMKVEGAAAKEQAFEGTGDYAGYVFDLSSLTVEQRNGIAKVVIFVAFDTADGATAEGTFEMHWAKFCGFENQSKVLEYNGKADHLDINRNYQILDADAFQLTTEVSPWVFAYSKGADRNYSAIIVEVAGQLGNFSKIEFGAKAGAGVKFMMKVEGAAVKEQAFEGTGDYAGYVFDLSSLTVEQRNGITKVVIFVAFDTAEGQTAEGTFEMHWAKFCGFTNPNVIVYDGTADHLDINKNYNILDADAFQLTTEASPWVFTYSKGADRNYSAIIVEVSGQLGNFSKIQFGAKAADGVKFMMKVEGAGVKEQAFEGTGDYCGDYVLDLSSLTVEQRNGITKVVIFVAFDTAEGQTAEGTFEMHWAKFCN